MPIHLLAVLTFLIFFPAVSFAENHLVYFGGGIEGVQDDESFDASYQNLINFSKKANWQSDYYYREGVAKKTGVKTFNGKNFVDKVTDLTQQIKNGQIPPGDQLMVYIDTHGAINRLTGTYQIATSDGEPVDPSCLKSLIEAAEKNKVKLAIVSQTCYSGSILDLDNANTCMISGSKADRLSYTNDGNKFSVYLEENAGKTNLEEAYLAGRVRSDNISGFVAPAQPMISTVPGKTADETLLPLKTYISDSKRAFSRISQPICRKNFSDLTSFKEDVSQFNKIVHQTYMGISFSTKTENLYQSLKKKIDAFEELSEKASRRLSPQTVVCGLLGDCYSLEEADVILASTVKSLEKCYKDNGFKRHACDKEEAEFRKLDSYVKSDDYKKYPEIEKQKENTRKNLYTLSAEISRDERLLYDQIYKEIAAKEKGSNPCRDFKL